MKEKDVLYLCVENLFATGILQSMVVQPARKIQEKYGLVVGFTAMTRDSEGGDFNVDLPRGSDVLVGRRSEKGLSIFNLVLHFTFLIRLIFFSRSYHILHCRSYMATALGLVCRFFWKQTVIFDVRGYLIDEAVESGKLSVSSYKYKVLRRLESCLFRKADIIISVSEAMQSDVLARYSRDSIVIRNPADIECVTEGFALAKKKIIAYNGSLKEWHLPDLFFKVVKIISDSDSEYRFRVVTQDVVVAQELIKCHEIDPFRVEVKSIAASEVVKELKGGGIGWCIIRPSFSKKVCWPVKFNEYLASKMPVIVNADIGDVEVLVSKYGLGLVASDLNDPKAIANKIMGFLECEEELMADSGVLDMISWETQLATLYSVYLSVASFGNSNES